MRRIMLEETDLFYGPRRDDTYLKVIQKIWNRSLIERYRQDRLRITPSDQES